MIQIAKRFKSYKKKRLKKILKEFDNKKNIQKALDLIIKYIKERKNSLKL